jgi:hypothetical protein
MKETTRKTWAQIEKTVLYGPCGNWVRVWRLDSCDSEQLPVAWSCEHSNEHLESIKGHAIRQLANERPKNQATKRTDQITNETYATQLNVATLHLFFTIIFTLNITLYSSVR